MLDKDCQPHVADFGLGLQEKDQWAEVGKISGTPLYMSPEQIRGETHHQDGRSDIWSLGVILYEILTGPSPFASDSKEHLFEEIVHRDPKPPRQIDDTISPELERIVLRCLAKRMQDRYLTASDLAGELRACFEEASHSTVISNTHATTATLDRFKRGVHGTASVGNIGCSVSILMACFLMAVVTWYLLRGVFDRNSVNDGPPIAANANDGAQRYEPDDSDERSSNEDSFKTAQTVGRGATSPPLPSLFLPDGPDEMVHATPNVLPPIPKRMMQELSPPTAGTYLGAIPRSESSFAHNDFPDNSVDPDVGRRLPRSVTVAEFPPEFVGAPSNESAPANKTNEPFKQALAAVEKAMKDKNMDVTKWTNVVVLLSNIEKQVTTREEMDATERIRKRLANLAEDRVESAIKQRGKNVFLYAKFLQEAAAMDPNGDAGKKAKQMLTAAGLGGAGT